MTNQQLVELIKYSPEFSDDQKTLYKSLLAKDLAADQAEEVKKLLEELLQEKMNLSILSGYLRESEGLKSLLESGVSEIQNEQERVEVGSRSDEIQRDEKDLKDLELLFLKKKQRMADIIKKTEENYNNLIKDVERKKIEDIKKQNDIE